MTLPMVTDVERIMVRVPFRERVAEWNSILVANWQIVEVIRVVTEDPDVVGYGETLVHYTWAPVTDDTIRRAVAHSIGAFMTDDSVGAGLQMALYDAVGKATGLPMHRLFGQPLVRDWCPISWWNTKMPPEILADEARSAVAEGYLAHKIKARPWFDVRDQIAAISSVTPPSYKVDIDWNSMLRSPAEALPLLLELSAEERVGIFESPIPRTDVAGHAMLRNRTGRPLAEHFDATLFPTWMARDALDGFVVYGAGVTGLVHQAALCAAFNKPFWLQVCGTGITTAMTAHLGATMTHARWPMVTGMNAFATDLLREPLTIRGGLVQVPTGPGLGIVVDESALERLQVSNLAPVKCPRRILTMQLNDGRAVHFASIESAWAYCLSDGALPVQPRGARLTLRPDDGTGDFAELYARAQRQAVWDVGS